MSEMVERVAKAISLGEWSDSEHWQCRAEREVWMERARAAIEEMRSPTHAMEDAGWAHMGTAPFSVFSAMVDKALATLPGETDR
jgi:hypothetical protein